MPAALQKAALPLAALTMALLLTAIYFPALWLADTNAYWWFAKTHVYNDWYPFGLPFLMGRFYELFIRLDEQSRTGLFTLLQSFLFWWATFRVALLFARPQWKRGILIAATAAYFVMWEVSLTQVTNVWAIIFFLFFVASAYRWFQLDAKGGVHLLSGLFFGFWVGAVRHEAGLSPFAFCLFVGFPTMRARFPCSRRLVWQKLAVILAGLFLIAGSKSVITRYLKNDDTVRMENMFLSYDLFGTLYYAHLNFQQLAQLQGSREFGLARLHNAISNYPNFTSIDYLIIGPNAHFKPKELFLSTFAVHDLIRVVRRHTLSFARHKLRIWSYLLQVRKPFYFFTGHQVPVDGFSGREASLLPRVHRRLVSLTERLPYHPFLTLFYRHGYFFFVTLWLLGLSLWLGGRNAFEDFKPALISLGTAMSFLFPNLLVTVAHDWRFLAGFNHCLWLTIVLNLYPVVEKSIAFNITRWRQREAFAR